MSAIPVKAAAAGGEQLCRGYLARALGREVRDDVREANQSALRGLPASVTREAVRRKMKSHGAVVLGRNNPAVAVDGALGRVSRLMTRTACSRAGRAPAGDAATF